MNTIIKNASVISDNKILNNAYVVIENGIITELSNENAEIPEKYKSCEIIDIAGNYLSPGFIDAHCHGGGGYDFMDGSANDIVEAARAQMLHGTTTIAPTSLSSFDEELYAFIDNYKQALSIKDQMPNLMGMHLEGPYFSAEFAGAQPPEHIKMPDINFVREVYDRSEGNILRWSIAPELPGSLDIADYLNSKGVFLSMAHTSANYSQISEAIKHGYRHLTHFYCCMSTIHRENGYRILGAIESGYLFDEINIEIIADGCHLPAELLKLIIKTKPFDKISLVTDAMRGAGMPEGCHSTLGSLKNGVDVILDGGVAKMPDMSCFAGSTATTDRMLRVMVNEVGLRLPDAVKLLSENPAKLYGIFDKTGSIAPGKQADFVVLDKRLVVKQVFVRGNAQIH